MFQIVSYLLDLPEKDEEEVERAQINSFDSLWGETGTSSEQSSALMGMLDLHEDTHMLPYSLTLPFVASVVVELLY